MTNFKKIKKTAFAKFSSKKIPLREEHPELPAMKIEESTAEYEEGQLSVDVFQTPDEIVIIAPVAGVKKSDLNVALTDEVLTIKGRRNFSFDVKSEDYFTKECFWGNFSRSVILPESIDASKVKAAFKDGILIVRVPKAEKIHTRTIEIREE